jgi:hypothetical protein
MKNAMPTTLASRWSRCIGIPSHYLLRTAHSLLATALERPCTLVDIRLKKAQKVPLSLTFQTARRDLDVSGFDPQTISCQADRTGHLDFPGG